MLYDFKGEGGGWYNCEVCGGEGGELFCAVMTRTGATSRSKLPFELFQTRLPTPAPPCSGWCLPRRQIRNTSWVWPRGRQQTGHILLCKRLGTRDGSGQAGEGIPEESRAEGGPAQPCHVSDVKCLYWKLKMIVKCCKTILP